MRLIDADLEIERISKEIEAKKESSGLQCLLEVLIDGCIQESLRNAPTFTGKFEDTGYSNSIGDIFQCSRCKGFINPTQEQIDRHGFPKHCPNCGAYADVEE